MPQWPSAASKQLKRWCWVCTSVWKTVNRCICPNINIIYITPKESLWSFSIIRIYALITHQSMVRSLSKSVTDKHNLTKPTSHTDFTCRYWTRWVMSHSPGWKSKWASLNLLYQARTPAEVCSSLCDPCNDEEEYSAILMNWIDLSVFSDFDWLITSLVYSAGACNLTENLPFPVSCQALNKYRH